MEYGANDYLQYFMKLVYGGIACMQLFCVRSAFLLYRTIRNRK